MSLSLLLVFTVLPNLVLQTSQPPPTPFFLVFTDGLDNQCLQSCSDHIRNEINH